jgi:hypothetical protein
MSRDEAFEGIRRVFEPRYQRKLSDEEVREIIHNLTGYFKLLAEWTKAEKSQRGDLPPTVADEQTAVKVNP